MNKAELVDAVAEHLGDRRTAEAAVDGVLHAVMRTVRDGGRVALSGFGVFEPRARAARTARNPRTGEAVEVAETTVPAFRPGTTFRAVVSGDRELGELDPAPAWAGRGAGPVASPDDVPRSAGVPLTPDPEDDREPAASGASTNGARPGDADESVADGEAPRGKPAKGRAAAATAKGKGGKSGKAGAGKAGKSDGKDGKDGKKAAAKGKQKTKK